MNERVRHDANSPLQGWFDHHVRSFGASLARIARRPFASLLTTIVMAMAFVLPLLLWTTLQTVERLAGDVQASRRIDVFLQPGVEAAKAQSLAEALRRRGDIAAVTLQTPEQGLAELRTRSGLGDAIDAAGENPLPYLLIVTPRGDERALATALQTLPTVDAVQHDSQWRNRLDGWLRLGAHIAWVLAALFGLAAALVVGNTVRLDIQSRREEIGVLQLLGASDGFIRRPFLYLGSLYGLIAAGMALGLLMLVIMALRAPLTALAASYGSKFALQTLAPLQVLAVLAGGVLLGWIGAALATGHFLRQTRPGAR